MKKPTTRQRLIEVLETLEKRPNLEQTRFAFGLPSKKAAWDQLLERGFDPQFLAEYEDLSGVKLGWRDKQDSTICGNAVFLTPELILKQQEGVIVFGDTPEDAWQRDFYPVDFFADEVCAGVFAGKNQSANRMYLYETDDEYPFNLGIGVQDYFDRMLAARAGDGWQYLLKEWSTKAPNPNAVRFRTIMTTAFGTFDEDTLRPRSLEPAATAGAPKRPKAKR
jgi:hypothetical protein